jgi:hypothetical protein
VSPDAICPTRADHDWSGQVFIAAGRDPVAGSFHTYRRRCYRCGKTETITDWTLKKLPSFDRVPVDPPPVK